MSFELVFEGVHLINAVMRVCSKLAHSHFAGLYGAKYVYSSYLCPHIFIYYTCLFWWMRTIPRLNYS